MAVFFNAVFCVEIEGDYLSIFHGLNYIRKKNYLLPFPA